MKYKKLSMDVIGTCVNKLRDARLTKPEFLDCMCVPQTCYRLYDKFLEISELADGVNHALRQVNDKYDRQLIRLSGWEW